MANAPHPSSIPTVLAEAGPAAGVGLLAGVQTLRLTTFRWSVGWFCAAIGAMMLVVPHQLSSPSFSVLRPYLAPMGGLALAGGVALIIVSALGVRGLWRVIAHLACGLVLVLFAFTLLRAGSLAGSTVYSTLGIGVSVATLLRSRPKGQLGRGDLLAVVLGICAMITGLVMLLFPGQFTLSIYDAISPFLRGFGAIYLLGGAALVLVQFRSPRALWRFWLPHAVLGLSFLAYLMLVSVPSRAITGMLFYGGFGVLLLLLPFVGTALDRFDPASLQIRLSLTLVAAAAIPLTTTVALITSQQERIAIDQTLTSRRLLAISLASNVGNYAAMHQSAVAALAATPSMRAATPEGQQALLQQLTTAYPEFFACATYDAAGAGVARSDGRSPMSSENVPLFAELKRSNTPALALHHSNSIQRPVIAFGAPLFAATRSFAGAVICGLEVNQLSDLIELISKDGDRDVVVFDARGQVVIATQPQLAPFTDLSGYQPVAALRAQPDEIGALRFGEPPDEQLGAFAPVAMLGWGVLVERSLADDLSPVRGARELAFGLLLLAITLAALAGALVANYLTAPLNALANAVSRFGGGDAAAPLPNQGVSEVRQVSAAFDQMRHDLTAAAQGREQAIQQRDTFFAVAAHELKTPLTALLGQAQLFQRRARREGKLTAKDQRSLDVVVAQALRLNALITDLLDVSRLEHGRLSLDRAPLDLRSLVTRVVNEFQPTIEPRLITTDGLDGPPLVISGDALRLEQVLHNLLSNAVKYSPAGGDVLVRLSHASQEARLAVIDSGIGIPAEALPQLFKRFFRAPNADPMKITGMGVGLFVVSEIVTLHGGRVEVTSVEGEGSTFTVVLPAELAR